MSLSYKMSLSMNYLRLNQLKRTLLDLQQVVLQMVWSVGGVDYYVYPEKGLPSSKKEIRMAPTDMQGLANGIQIITCKRILI